MIPYAEVIGDPIAHSRSPGIHNFWLEACGLAGDYRATRVAAAELGDYLGRRRADPNWRGCNLTAPLKEAVLPLLDALDGEAEATGAVNCLAPQGDGLTGRNSDVLGIAEALRPFALAGRPAALIGAGGAARAALRHLANAGAAPIRIVARDLEKARSLQSIAAIEIYGFTDAPAAMAGSAAVINATPLGMTHSAPMPEDLLESLPAAAPGAAVLDMVYEPLDTPLLAAARHYGLATIDGLVMLLGQADFAFRLFFGTAPPRERDAELRQRLLSP